MLTMLAALRFLGRLVWACAECRDPELRAVAIRQEVVRSKLETLPLDGDD